MNQVPNASFSAPGFGRKWLEVLLRNLFGLSLFGGWPIALPAAQNALIAVHDESSEVLRILGIEGTGQSLRLPHSAVLTAAAFRLEASRSEGPGSFRVGLWQIDTSRLTPAPGGFTGAVGRLLVGGRIDQSQIAMTGVQWHTVTFTEPYYAAGGSSLYLQIEPEQPDAAGFNRFAFSEANPYGEGTAISFRAPFDPTFFQTLPQRDLIFVLYHEVPELEWSENSLYELRVPHSLIGLDYYLYSFFPGRSEGSQWTWQATLPGRDGPLTFAVGEFVQPVFYQVWARPSNP